MQNSSRTIGTTGFSSSARSQSFWSLGDQGRRQRVKLFLSDSLGRVQVRAGRLLTLESRRMTFQSKQLSIVRHSTFAGCPELTNSPRPSPTKLFERGSCVFGSSRLVVRPVSGGALDGASLWPTEEASRHHGTFLRD
jgi:hypothetical protein